MVRPNHHVYCRYAIGNSFIYYCISHLKLVSNSMLGLILALTIGWIGRYLRYFRNLTRDIQKRPFVSYARLVVTQRLKRQ